MGSNGQRILLSPLAVEDDPLPSCRSLPDLHWSIACTSDQLTINLADSNLTLS
jgi:hypothetical protein